MFRRLAHRLGQQKLNVHCIQNYTTAYYNQSYNTKVEQKVACRVGQDYSDQYKYPEVNDLHCNVVLVARGIKEQV